VFFTKNGKFIGVAHSDAQGKELYPSAGLHTRGEKITFNFGKKPFKFNLETGPTPRRLLSLALHCSCPFTPPEVVQWKTITPRGEVPDGRAAAHLFPFEDNKLVLLGGYNPIHIFQDVHVLDTGEMLKSALAHLLDPSFKRLLFVVPSKIRCFGPR